MKKNLLLGFTYIFVVPFATLATVSCQTESKSHVYFETDTWENVVAYANQGLDALKEHYQLDTFVGLEREVTINGLEHTVKVIGENEDFQCKEIAPGLVDPDYEKPVALTFQFDNVISYIDEDGEILPDKVRFASSSVIGEEEPEIIYLTSWSSSEAKDYLNNPDYQPEEETRNDDYQPFITQLKQQLGDDAIKTVYKTSFDTSRTGHIGYNWFTLPIGGKEQIFIPSLADIYTGDDCLPKPPSTWGQAYKDYYKDEGNVKSVGEEPSAYSYYQNILGTQFGYTDFVRSLILSDCSDITCQYWLRTGWLEDIDPFDLTFHQWSMSRWGICCDDGRTPTPIDIKTGLAPIFCI